jgi:iron complex outermembrane recepter protein
MKISLRHSTLALLFTSAAFGTARAAEPQTKPTELSKITVQEAVDSDFVAPDATTGTKTDTPTMETPLSVQVVPQQILQDQQVIRLEQALRNVSGVVSTQTSNGGLDDEFTIRGFNTQTQFRNGIRLDFNVAAGTRQMANVESVEVLKGPAAILYGRLEPGGAVNVVTKRPLAEEQYSVSQQVGTDDLFRTAIDTTGPLNASRTLRYRVNMSYESSGSDLQFVNARQLFFAPTLEWIAGPRTDVRMEVEFRRGSTGLGYQYLPYANGQFVWLPRTQSIAEASPSHESEVVTALNWSHRFSDAWSLDQQVFLRRTKEDGDHTYVWDYDLTAGEAYRYRYISSAADDLTATVLDLTGHLHTGKLRHTLLVGGDFYQGDWADKRAMAGLDTDFNFIGSTIDLFHPVHPGTPPAGELVPLRVGGYKDVTNSIGLYMQDQVEWPHGVHLLAGYRYSRVHDNTHSRGADDFGFPPYSEVYSDHATTPRLAALWRPRDWLSLYANYVENFGANNGRSYDGTPLPPQSGQQKEVGIKTEFFGGRLRAELALYDLVKQNVPAMDPLHEGYQIVIGAVRSRGPEVDLRGELLPGLNVVLTYAYQDVFVSRSNDVPGSPIAGSRLMNVPRNTGSAWASYEVTGGSLKGFKVGGGISLQDQSVNYGNSYLTPGSALVSLMAGYGTRWNNYKVSAQLNIDNLLDQKTVTSANGGYLAYATYQKRRSAVILLRLQF